MRPLRLDLQGFTVFREPTTVDFTDADFFVLVGPTGSGKSTVLDAICFALYGTVPRWGDRRRIEHALAPSAAQASVRFVFEAAGGRFVATRVVRRDGKGKVSTGFAGLEQLPPGFDLARFDAAPSARGEELGTVLAGTPAEMDAAVREVVGLPYEQFTSCVVLPQGEFARFLHATPAQRQDILVNLLGLGIYDRIGEHARDEARQADAAAAATRGVLAELSQADDAALAAARAAAVAGRDLVAGVEVALPPLVQALEQTRAAGADLARVEAEIAALAAVAPPKAVASLAGAVAAARQAAEVAATAVTTLEERDEKLRAELTGAGDRAELQRLLDTYAERARIVTQASSLQSKVDTEGAAYAKTKAALAAAQEKATAARDAVTTGRQRFEAAQTADRAASLRPHLVAGEPCPVCEQTVLTPPPVSAAPAMARARTVLDKAEKAAEVADRAVAEHDSKLRAADRTLAALEAQYEQLALRLATAASTLAGAPAPEAVTAELSAIAATEQAVTRSGDELREARLLARTTATELVRGQERLREAWRGFDAVRDALAAYAPPAPDRDDLTGAWQALTTWAAAAAEIRRGQRSQVAAARSEAAKAVDAARAVALGLFAAAGEPVSAAAEPAALRQAAALAAQRGEADLARVLERREQAATMAALVAEHEQRATVARALGRHLQANNFTRWLLEEATSALVGGASVILRELSGGQYDLVTDGGDFAVVDHADAGLRRSVRTLSGGETFQASLALALALSEQLAGLSTTAASLESIMLDEGFGTLDPETLDSVAATLENLASRGDRMVGVVTHVSALAERIPVRFEVRRDATGNARVERLG